MPEKTAKEIFAENLHYYMELKNVKQVDLVNYFKIGKSTISSWCTGLKMPRSDKLEMLAEFFDIELSDLLHKKVGTPYNPTVHKIPVLGYISAGLPLYADEHIIDYTYTDLNGGAEYFALKVKGDSMNAAQINDGNTVIVRVQPIVENGDIAVVRVDGDEATIKRFKRDGDEVQLIPQSYNPEHSIQSYNLKKTKIDVVGKVVECKIEF